MSYHPILANLFVAGALLAGMSGPPAKAQTAALFSQDITLHEITTTAGGPMGAGREMAATAYFSGNAMKHASETGDFIILYDRQKIIMVDHKNKTYSEMTLQQMQQMAEKALADSGMNKEQMEAMRQVMGGAGGDVTVTSEGPGEVIAGYATEKHRLRIGPMEVQIWAAPDLTVPAVYYDAFKLSMPKNPMLDLGKMYDEMKKIKGMTMQSVMSMKMMGMTIGSTTLVKSVEKGAIPASVFEVPVGYKPTPFKF
jgi:hypothetical protein